ncbi:MAG: Rrf2 family transcriptional regulator [Verrucomicrobiota bacterium]
MKVSKKSEYAVRALVEMTLHTRSSNCEWRQISTIAEATGIPEKYLEQILLNLKKGGLLKSRRGIEGGYALNVNPTEISIHNIFELLEGTETFTTTSNNKEDATSQIFGDIIRRATQASYEILNHCSLEEMSNQVSQLRSKQKDIIEYHI